MRNTMFAYQDIFKISNGEGGTNMTIEYVEETSIKLKLDSSAFSKSLKNIEKALKGFRLELEKPLFLRFEDNTIKQRDNLRKIINNHGKQLSLFTNDRVYNSNGDNPTKGNSNISSLRQIDRYSRELGRTIGSINGSLKKLDKETSRLDRLDKRLLAQPERMITNALDSIGKSVNSFAKGLNNILNKAFSAIVGYSSFGGLLRNYVRNLQKFDWYEINKLRRTTSNRRMNSLVDAAANGSSNSYYGDILYGNASVRGNDITLNRRNGISEEYNRRIFDNSNFLPGSRRHRIAIAKNPFDEIDNKIVYEFQDSLETLRANMERLTVVVGRHLLPFLNRAADRLNSLDPNKLAVLLGGVVALNTQMKLFGTKMGLLMTAFEGVILFAKKLSDSGVNMDKFLKLTAEMSGTLVIFKKFGFEVGLAVTAFELLINNMNRIYAILSKIFPSLNGNKEDNIGYSRNLDKMGMYGGLRSILSPDMSRNNIMSTIDRINNGDRIPPVSSLSHILNDSRNINQNRINNYINIRSDATTLSQLTRDIESHTGDRNIFFMNNANYGGIY